ncbi:hypothetical protein [Variovorax arabinosiphilus]|uniref:hypothetical protein n=1 Tax=Variovorax arabinosiphilus TaxID=3053498 RepID=UPI002576110F|nr:MULTISPECIES: hypothetical protein [unclassified Variovorax]MDM0118921.1 hypothetical protein [Variovorax sp. J2L1-78]MDM0129347.1 hypothetical protein [Variovorax sp. J2L1-63]MDM0232867.1 hypothetical protein [Variovorax sp. J2R1-6]
MKIHHSIDERPVLGDRWEDLWQGPDQGLLCSWARGIEKAGQDPSLAEAARRGELPELAWKGGGPAIKAGKRLGALHYLATWQGLRGEDLDIDTEARPLVTCSMTGMAVTFTSDLGALAKSTVEAGGSA